MSLFDKDQYLQDGERLALLKRLFGENFFAYKVQYLAAIFFMIIMATMSSLSAWILKDIVDSLFVDKDFQKVVWVAVIVAAIFITRGLATYMQSILLTRIGNGIVARIQKQIYQHMLRLDMGFFDSVNSSETLTRMSQIANNAREAINLITLTVFRDTFTLLGLFVVMVIQQPLLTVLAALFAPIGIFGLQKLAKKVRKHAFNHYTSGVELMKAVQEGVRGIQVIKSFGLEPFMNDRMEKTAENFANQSTKVAITNARSVPIVDTLSGLAIAAVIVYAGWRTTFHEATPGQFVSFIGALLLAYEPAKRLARVRIIIEGHLVGVKILYQLLDQPHSETEREDKPQLALQNGAIEFDNLAFSYHHETPALSGISLNIEPQSRIALVGESGSGKSTIVKLLMRFYDVDTGQIKIDGQDLTQITAQSLRQHISFVGQDAFMFSGTVKENIMLGRPDASEDEIKAAAERAQAHDFISNFPNGYDSDVGEGGSLLSGGQKQRLSIARAILKDSPIILLDEATSALDSESEDLVQKGLESLTKNRTTVMIAHRLSTVRNADRIYALRNGKIVESGTHDELMRQDGYYARLSALQFS